MKLAAAALALGCLGLAQPDTRVGREVRLFDGRSFAGWEGNLSVFRIEKGAIVGGTLAAPVARNEFLCTKSEYADFTLKLQFRLLGEGANAGVQIRSRRIPGHNEVIGYQADLGDGWWGALYDESRRNRPLAKPDDAAVKKALRPREWNQYEIRAEGRRIRTWINGKPMIDYTEPDEQIEQKGLICLQIHGGPPSEAWYRDIRIRTAGGQKQNAGRDGPAWDW